MYVVTSTPPNLIFKICYLMGCFSASNKQYVAVVKYCWSYINGTEQLTFPYPYGDEIFMVRFSNSDYGDYINIRSYISRYVFKLGY
jgi:hypothetical protein